MNLPIFICYAVV